MMRILGLVCGMLFGLGLAISGMVSPAKVQGFLDITGAWDPSLILVMAGALLVFMPGYWWLIQPRSLAMNGEPFDIPRGSLINGRLIFGAAIFGIGWGMAGICPGPAITLLSEANGPLLLFVLAMLIGIKLVYWFDQRHIPPAKQAQSAR